MRQVGLRAIKTIGVSLLLGGLIGCNGAAPAASPTSPPAQTSAPAVASSAAPTTAVASPVAAAPAAASPSPVAASAAASPSPVAASAAASPSPVAASANPAAGSAYTPDPPLNPPATVKVGVFGVVPDGAYIVGEQRGYFAAEGITVQTQRFTSSTDALPALTTGDIEVYGASPNPAMFNAIGRGIELHVLGPIGNTAPGHDPNAVVVRQDLIDSGRFKTLKDLKGMKMAVGTLFSTSHFTLKMALESVGLTLNDVDVNALGVASLVPAVAGKSIDGFASTEPGPTQAEQQGVGKVVARLLDVAPDRAAGGNGVLVGSAAFLADRGAQRFLIAYVRSQIDLDNALNSPNPQERDAMVKLLSDNGIAVAIGVQQGTFPRRAETDPKGLQTLLSWYQEAGAVTTPIDLNTVVNYGLLVKAYQRLGYQ